MRAVCFYLPQYHPIPENDAWWGPGFTEWTNVARARPRFPGHHQPQIPADLGFYDLRLEETRLAQAELARRYGIGGFCYYHYWFNGKQLLERPFEEVLRSGQPDFPFCLCWANGNWTRSWDGRDREILIAQEYDSYDPEAHLTWLSRAFADPRYITIRGRPLFLVYDAAAIPMLADVVRGWRAAARRQRMVDPYLCAVDSPGNPLAVDALLTAGFDAVVEFYPKGYRQPAGVLDNEAGRALVRTYRRVKPYLPLIRSRAERRSINLQSYRALVEAITRSTATDERVFPCVMPSWDNSARRARGATVIQNDDPALYQRWLEHACSRVAHRQPDEQLVFINAWNEWGEGCHLEPDLRHGHRFLEATRGALRPRAASGAPRSEAA